MLELGFKTAHTAYTKECFKKAQVIADTPIFCDFIKLDQQYPNSKFINLTRKTDDWLPSIRQLLERMYVNLQRNDGGFNPHIKRCFNEVFKPLTQENIASDDFLIDCYQRHQRAILNHFKQRKSDLLSINIGESGSYQKLLAFLNLPEDHDKNFEVINKGGKVTAWNKIKHPLKIESTRNGRIDNAL
ncbi:sulfotransferase family protein [Thalassotalea sp. M1531]|uniref:Sulfotransferase family protein n=1 Tax=Thalassotalea algicola TaxID=2716224 RepID=A0A7Y0Q8U3_9GAMM|nr:sulfotransferase [Thalassotalea algicola]NMP32525.1 sulfotransferase family protein [Thalassotalea algicola]